MKYTAILIILAGLLSGCAVNHVRLAEDFKRSKHYEESLQQYLQAMKTSPDDISLKVDIDRLLKEAAQYYFYLGQEQETMGKKEMAVFLYKKSLEFDPANNQSRQAMGQLLNKSKGITNLKQIKQEMALNVGMPRVMNETKRFDLLFGSKISIKKIFHSLSKTGNVNILFDSSFRDRKITTSLENVTFGESLERLCTMFNYRHYILDNQNIIITQDSADSKKRFKKLLIKNIFFSNIEAQTAKQIIESVLRPEKLILNQHTNSLIVVDSLQNLSFVEKLSQFLDKRMGEIEVEVEIMEVDRKKLQEYGTELSTYQVGFELEGYSQGKRLNDLYYLGSDELKLSMPKAVWKFFSSVTNTKILARPRLRGLDRQKISIKLGEKRPIPRTTFVPVSQGGPDQQAITSFDLRDVGISLDITPVIHHNREVTLSLTFELTYVTDLGGTNIPPTLGNRKVITSLRLRDGESGIIAGLMRGSTTGSTDGVPLLSRIPLIKEIFSSRSKLKERTDILLSITPRILRMPEISRSDMEAYFMGTGRKIELKSWKSSKKSKRKIQ